MISIYSIGKFFDHQANLLASRQPDGARVITCSRTQGFDYRDYAGGVPGPWNNWREGIRELLTGDVFVIWNGRLPHLLPLVEEARAKGMRCCFLENGFFPGTQQFDPQGVNAASTAADIPASHFAGLPVDDDIWNTRFFQRPVEFTTDCPPLSADYSPLEAGYVLLPMQIEDDTQIKDFSPAYHGMAEVIEAVLDALPSGMRLVIKEHPSEYSRAGGDSLRERFPQATWCRYRAIDDLLAGACACVTVNSSVGLHALCYGVPLVVLGEALYARPQWCAMPEDDIAEALRHALEGARMIRQRSDLLGAFLTWLRDQWSMPWEPEVWTARLADIAAGRAPWIPGEEARP